MAAALVFSVVGGISLVTLPLQGSDKTEAAEALVAWIVEDRPIPGFRDAYADAMHMRVPRRFFVVCDFVPEEMPLSADQRVKRITESEYKAVFRKHGYNDTVYICVTRESESDRPLVVSFFIAFGSGHHYTFEFYRNIWGQRANGQLHGIFCGMRGPIEAPRPEARS